MLFDMKVRYLILEFYCFLAFVLLLFCEFPVKKLEKMPLQNHKHSTTNNLQKYHRTELFLLLVARLGIKIFALYELALHRNAEGSSSFDISDMADSNVFSKLH